MSVCWYVISLRCRFVNIEPIVNVDEKQPKSDGRQHQDMCNTEYPVDFHHVWAHFKHNNKLRSSVQNPSPYGWLSIFCNLFQPAHLSGELISEKEILIGLSKSSFSDENPIHLKMIYTLYYKLTGLHSQSRYGAHWETVGFQGSDPATDFRGVGVLGLLQPVALSLSELSLPFLKEVLEFSQDEEQGFPFMVLSLNITNIVLNSLRNGHLDKLIRFKGSSVEAANLFYGAVLFYIYDQWKNDKLSLVQSGQLLKKAEVVCNKDIRQSVERVESYLEKLKSHKVDQQSTTDASLEQVQLTLNEVHVAEN